MRCQYCKGGEPTCKACNPEGFMRCESCNPYTHGGTILDRPGWLRCPANCDAGYFVCPECMIYKWGGGKVSCGTCGERGVIAMEVPDDPPVA